MFIGGGLLKIINTYHGSWLSNCYVLLSSDSQGKTHAAVVDPSSPADDILTLLDSHGATLDLIIMTHGHFDHIMSLDSLREKTGATVCIHKDDAEMLGDGKKNAYSFFFGTSFEQKEADKLLSDGDMINIGDEALRVIHLPGHSKGSIALLGDDFIVTGDTIFSEGFGRYDLHGGDPMILKKSLNLLKSLDGSLTLYAGHGESSKLGAALRAISYFLN